MLHFVYLNVIYSDLQNSYSALSESNSKYESLYVKCSEDNKQNTNVSKEFENVLEEVNLTLRK